MLHPYTSYVVSSLIHHIVCYMHIYSTGDSASEEVCTAAATLAEQHHARHNTVSAFSTAAAAAAYAPAAGVLHVRPGCEPVLFQQRFRGWERASVVGDAPATVAAAAAGLAPPAAPPALLTTPNRGARKGISFSPQQQQGGQHSRRVSSSSGGSGGTGSAGGSTPPLSKWGTPGSHGRQRSHNYRYVISRQSA
jgi:uncharacterized membrane protein YgcG